MSWILLIVSVLLPVRKALYAFGPLTPALVSTSSPVTLPFLFRIIFFIIIIVRCHHSRLTYNCLTSYTNRTYVASGVVEIKRQPPSLVIRRRDRQSPGPSHRKSPPHLWKPPARNHPPGTSQPILAIQHDDRKLIVGADDVVQTWDIRTGELLDEMKGIASIWQVAFDRRRRVVAFNLMEPCAYGQHAITYLEVLCLAFDDLT